MATKLTAIAPIALITLIGGALRICQADQSIVGDEMWSYVAATNPNFSGMLDFVRSGQEITPPLFTALAWLAARIGDSAVVLRLPPLIAGVATIPIVYAIGLRTLGRRSAAVGALLAALSPFLIWYSIELRAYGLAIALVAASTLTLLVASDRRQAGWWVAYGALSCAAMYTHYTAVYVLLAQVAWVLIFRPRARVPLLLANAGAAAAFLPWLPSLRDDFHSPSQDISGVLAPFGLDNVADFTARSAFGSPAVPLGDLIGVVGAVTIALGLVVAVAGLIYRRSRPAAESRDAAAPRDFLILLAMLAAAAPVGVALVSLVGDDQFLPRNLATSVPAFLLLVSGLLMAGPLLTRFVSTVLVVGVLAFGALRSTEPAFQRTDWAGAAGVIDAQAGPGDVVLSISGATAKRTPEGDLSPPAYTLDRALSRPHRVIDAVDPAAIELARREAADGHLYLVGDPVFVEAVRDQLGLDTATPIVDMTFPGASLLLLESFSVPAAPGA